MDLSKLTDAINAEKDSKFAEALAEGGDTLIADALNLVDPAILIQEPRRLSVTDLLGFLVQKGVLTQKDADDLTAATTRPGSRAEELYGAGTVITHTEVAVALGRGTL
jgi:hypothetical protein